MASWAALVENGESGGHVWPESRRFPRSSGVLGLSSRVRGAASTLQAQPHGPPLASSGATKTAPPFLTARACSSYCGAPHVCRRHGIR